MKKNGVRNFNLEVDLSEAMGSAQVFKDRGLIEGVVILTGEKVSRNKTFYTSSAMKEAVVRYEGAKMFIDHPPQGDTGTRSIRDLGGHYRNLRLEENKFLKADLHLLPNDDIRNTILPIAETKMAGVGLSIRDRGRGREEDGVFMVEGFTNSKGYSIDLVTEASVNENLFESDEGGNMDLSKVTLEELTEGNPALVEKIKIDERKTALEEFDKKSEEERNKLLAESKKTLALAEANLPSDIAEKVKKMIEPGSITFEVAESIIKNQKEIIEASKKGEGDPSVRGHGAGKGGDGEGKTEIPDDKELAEALAV